MRRPLFPFVLKCGKTDAPARRFFLQVFSLGGQPAQAMKSYEKANAWQELFTLALTDGKRPASEIKVLAVEVAGPFLPSTFGRLGN